VLWWWGGRGDSGGDGMVVVKVFEMVV